MAEIVWDTNPTEADVEAVKALTRATGVFSEEEVEMSGDMITDTLTDRFFYNFLFARIDGKLAGYSCFGHIEMTKSSYDLFWIAASPDFQGKGIAAQILKRSEVIIRDEAGAQVYAETSSGPLYQPARSFYEKNGFTEMARFPDFYKPGDAKVVFCKTV